MSWLAVWILGRRRGALSHGERPTLKYDQAFRVQLFWYHGIRSAATRQEESGMAVGERR